MLLLVMKLHKIKQIMLFLSILLFLTGAKPQDTSRPFKKVAKPSILIKGVTGRILTNIQSRLQELNTPLQNRSEVDELQGNLDTEALIIQIKKAMEPYGFFKPQINIVQNASGLTVWIQKGPRIVIASIQLHLIGQGQDNFQLQQALHAFPIRSGKPFNTLKYAKAKQYLLDTAEHQGFLHATFTQAEVRIDEVLYKIDIYLTLDTGPRYFFGQVQFDPTYISPELLQRYIPFRPEQPYSTDTILAFNNALTGSGYFKTVIVKPVISNNLIIPVQVHTQPAPRMSYSLGLGFGTDTGIRGRAGLHIIPVNRAGHEFNLSGLGSFNENALQAQYIIPGHDPLVNQYEIVGNGATLNYDVGYSNSGALSFIQRHTLAHFQRVISLNNLYERFNYAYEPKEEVFTLYPKISLTWLSNAHELLVPNGYKITLNGLAASKALLSELNFSQVSLDAKAALTWPLIRTRFYLHGYQGYTHVNYINQLPLSLALLLGGSDNLKGYEYNSIGPGKNLSYAGLEIQKETIENWFLTVFVDEGDVYNPSIKAWKRDVGLGLMWNSPVGPIKIGLALPVQNNFSRVPHKNPRLVVSMGPDL